jgi:16S rRNA processing protein RimM
LETPDETCENLLLLGKVLRPHGLGGLLRIASYAESEDSFAKKRVFFRDPRGVLREEEVVSVQPHQEAFLMKLKGIDTIDKAEVLRGSSIYVEKRSLEREEQEFFWHEIIGLEVFLRSGRHIGRVLNIFPTAGNDIYVVQAAGSESELLIPAVQGVVEEVDLPGRKMVISDMEGLLELNEA